LVYSRLAPAYAEAYDLGPALVCDREALRLYSQINYRSRLGAANHNLAETYVLLGAYEQAQVHVLKSLEIARQQAVKLDEANTLCVYATALNRLGQTDVAEKKFGAAIKAQKDLNLNFSLRFSLLDWGDFQRQVGRLAEAEITLSEALALNNDQPYLKLTTQAKQAMVCLAQGKSRAAIALADEVWQAIEPSRGKGFPLPIDTMVECYTIFQACNDGRAKTAINLAAEVLERTAAGIDDPEMRSTFLNNVPVNRQVKVALLEGYAETSVT
jgi:tetratricopeptide (TPR) repeat protein